MVDTRHPAPPPPPAARPTQPAPPASAQHPAEPAKRDAPGKLPPVGSKDYIAGQPIDEEEQKKTEGDHDALMKAGEEKRKAAEAKAHRDDPKASHHDDPDKDKHTGR
jgi:hypothetical protein